MRLGRHVTERDLADDWTMTHEFVHMALSSLPDNQSGMEEGLATYVEPIARAQAGQLPVRRVWAGTIQGMSQGQPKRGDLGLDQTRSWGRTYWGGAMFCLVADVEIRRKTENRKGLQDALRAIVASGGTIDKEWPLLKVSEIGDKATEQQFLLTCTTNGRTDRPQSTSRTCGLNWEFGDPERMEWNSRPGRYYPI
jgi:hypothetical protein